MVNRIKWEGWKGVNILRVKVYCSVKEVIGKMVEGKELLMFLHAQHRVDILNDWSCDLTIGRLDSSMGLAM